MGHRHEEDAPDEYAVKDLGALRQLEGGADPDADQYHETVAQLIASLEVPGRGARLVSGPGLRRVVDQVDPFEYAHIPPGPEVHHLTEAPAGHVLRVGVKWKRGVMPGARLLPDQEWSSHSVILRP